MDRRGDIRIGVSGWTYTPWRGNFYPKGLPQKRELSYAAQQFNALEINGTFYRLQKPASFANSAQAIWIGPPWYPYVIVLGFFLA